MYIFSFVIIIIIPLDKIEFFQLKTNQNKNKNIPCIFVKKNSTLNDEIKFSSIKDKDRWPYRKSTTTNQINK
ncbi:hypothetical protein DERP_006152 [Dermatophagoides pteronyssinus]|uniref:Secreted protein n=1 Tax=Dermatophagoides pteronyssinus TaxID=6956 RepID=A0ABQ8JSF8_DERPT|nr:hypothetical protein DERP_006152 [Dermatophagoides pteronyssinus]